jgi:16S rRNA (guanine966-N2)-methyltransferase
MSVAIVARHLPRKSVLRYPRAMGSPAIPSAHSGRGRAERQLRIIAGRWRGRRWRFPAAALRPTPDRVRETLFNWLQGRTEGAHCLDLYAGSGALGLEALSRGAASATFVEHEHAVAQALMRLLADWQSSGAYVVRESAKQFLRDADAAAPRAAHAMRPARGFDLVFLDPPFASKELAAIPALLARGWLAPEARIYIEHARATPLPPLPADWRELRAGTAGEVGYHLFAPAGGASA